MARLAATSLKLPEWDIDLSLHAQPQQTEFDKLLEVSKNLDLDSGEIVGGLLKWHRADGYAWYVVTKARPLTLQHVDYGDGWTVEAALIRGLNTQDVLHMLHRDARMRTLFSGGKK